MTSGAIIEGQQWQSTLKSIFFGAESTHLAKHPIFVLEFWSGAGSIGLKPLGQI
ncbi:hypothetical protein SETIT_7G031000v2 [Setaria italica]|uniref:Uncharacterized protein n=1 Tax=Setaria italica TaxID=4555 RepID=A0A368RRD4_SETIT|nr:hypothetical protein SETIT_7G031000v2 [Setaria italica]